MLTSLNLLLFDTFRNVLIIIKYADSDRHPEPGRVLLRVYATSRLEAVYDPSTLEATTRMLSLCKM